MDARGYGTGLHAADRKPIADGNDPAAGSGLSAIGLHACYAKSGTDLVYGPMAYSAIGLRACYARSGTDGAYGGPAVLFHAGVLYRVSSLSPMVLRAD
eukprot:3934426-Rhodomonas_salina.1